MKIDCHCHTVYSKHWFWGFDALNTPQEMIKIAIKRGLDGLAIVDHDNVKGSLAAKKVAKRYKFLIITGAEIKTKSGDLIALGIKENVPVFLSLEETIEKVHDLGGITIAPHPYRGLGLADKALKLDLDAIETLNGITPPNQNKQAQQLAKTKHLPGVAGSDAHFDTDPWNVCTEIRATLDIEEILEAIRKGNVKATYTDKSIHF